MHGMVNKIHVLEYPSELLKNLYYLLVNGMIQHVSGEHINTITIK